MLLKQLGKRRALLRWADKQIEAQATPSVKVGLEEGHSGAGCVVNVQQWG